MYYLQCWNHFSLQYEFKWGAKLRDFFLMQGWKWTEELFVLQDGLKKKKSRMKKKKSFHAFVLIFAAMPAIHPLSDLTTAAALHINNYE